VRESAARELVLMGGENVAVFKCGACGATAEGRCKPKACPKCGKDGTMAKQA